STRESPPMCRMPVCVSAESVLCSECTTTSAPAAKAVGGITVCGIIWLPCASSTSSGTPASRHSWAIVSIGLRAPAYVGETTTSPANSLPQRSSSRPMQVAETGPHTPQLSSQTGSYQMGKSPLSTSPLMIDRCALRGTNTVEPLDDKAIIEAARAAEAPLTEMIDCDAPPTPAPRPP